jgi:3'-phosphoadenosine 5'-phosphosulfate sulfotransferase (PAPS reductase)/FAD synthetase
MTPPTAVVSVSGGKDSTATALLALDRHGRDRCRFVFADTGHEHPLTLEYLFGAFQDSLGVKIDVVRADFSEDIERRRRHIAKRWPRDLMAGRRGGWFFDGVPADGDLFLCSPQKPENIYRPIKDGKWEWVPEIDPLSEMKAMDRVARALAVMRQTGIPFLDLCLIKGRFPSRMAQFCTQELKRRPLDRYMLDLQSEIGWGNVESWQGVRRDESLRRANVLDRERTPEGWEIVRPIAAWTAQQVIDFVVSRGIPLNPLYALGQDRVGCLPCINETKDGINNIDLRWAWAIDKLEMWELWVGAVSKRGYSTFFHHVDGKESSPEEVFKACNIRSAALWAKTKRGRKGFDPSRSAEPAMCSSSYGLCE